MLYLFNSFAIAIDRTENISFANKIDIVCCSITFHGNIDINLFSTLSINIDINLLNTLATNIDISYTITLIYLIDINVRIQYTGI